MYKEFFKDSTLLGYPLFSLVFFACVFAAILVMAFVYYRGGRVEQLAQMPLQDDDTPANVRPGALKE